MDDDLYDEEYHLIYNDSYLNYNRREEDSYLRDKWKKPENVQFRREKRKIEQYYKFANSISEQIWSCRVITPNRRFNVYEYKQIRHEYGIHNFNQQEVRIWISREELNWFVSIKQQLTDEYLSIPYKLGQENKMMNLVSGVLSIKGYPFHLRKDIETTGIIRELKYQVDNPVLIPKLNILDTNGDSYNIKELIISDPNSK